MRYPRTALLPSRLGTIGAANVRERLPRARLLRHGTSAATPTTAKATGYATCAAHMPNTAALSAAALVANRSARSSHDSRGRAAPSAAATATVNNAPNRIASACKMGLY